MSKLEITVKMTLKDSFLRGEPYLDAIDREECQLRQFATQLQNLAELVGRDKFEVIVTYDKLVKKQSNKRRPSERKPKSKRSSR